MASPQKAIQFEGVKEVWLVVQDRYISDLPRDWRFYVLWAYVLLGRFLHLALKSPVPRPNGHWLERSGCFLTNEQATKELKGKGWVARPIPFGKCMPLETCRYGDLIFSDGKVTEKYKKREFDSSLIDNVDKSRLIEVRRQGESLIQSIRT